MSDDVMLIGGAGNTSDVYCRACGKHIGVIDWDNGGKSTRESHQCEPDEARCLGQIEDVLYSPVKSDKFVLSNKMDRIKKIVEQWQQSPPWSEDD